MTNHQFAQEVVRWNKDAMAFVPADHPNYETIAQNFLREHSRDFNFIKATNHPSYLTLVLKAVKQDGYVIRYIPISHPGYTDTLNYATFALEAVKQHGAVIEYIQKSHPNYTDTLNYATIALAAVEKDPCAIAHIPTSHPNYTDTLNYTTLALKVVSREPYYIEYIGEDYPDYPAIAIEAIKRNRNTINFISKTHPNYMTILLFAVKQNPALFREIPKELITIDFALEFVKCQPHLLSYFRTLEKDKDYPLLLLEGVKRCGQNIEFVPKEHPHYTATLNYATLALEAVKQNGTNIQFISTTHSSYTTTLNYRTIALEAIRQSPDAFSYIKNYVPNYGDLVLKMMQKWPNYSVELLIRYAGDVSVILDAKKPS